MNFSVLIMANNFTPNISKLYNKQIHYAGNDKFLGNNTFYDILSTVIYWTRY